MKWLFQQKGYIGQKPSMTTDMLIAAKTPFQKGLVTLNFVIKLKVKYSRFNWLFQKSQISKNQLKASYYGTYKLNTS